MGTIQHCLIMCTIIFTVEKIWKISAPHIIDPALKCCKQSLVTDTSVAFHLDFNIYFLCLYMSGLIILFGSNVRESEFLSDSENSSSICSNCWLTA